ncbi:hypothetical protein MBLNU459_g4018t1 [Dothideomycetes sp. NU459]
MNYSTPYCVLINRDPGSRPASDNDDLHGQRRAAFLLQASHRICIQQFALSIQLPSVSSADMTSPAVNRPYVHNGQTLSGPPLTVRLRNFMDSAYVFVGLYVTTFFSFEPYAAAEASPFNQAKRTPGKRPGWGGYGGGRGGGGGGGGGGPGSGPGGPGSGPGKKLGRVDDIRGPECKSCQ